MKTEEMILANEFCVHHKIEMSFITSLQASGLIEITTIENNIFLPLSQLSQLEKLVRFHYEMDINMEGIEAITLLLEQIDSMQQQILRLANQLSVFENQ